MSFSVDTTSLITTASSMFNALIPILMVVAGISLGIGLAVLVAKEIKSAV
jgi:hypothetical protein